MRICDFEGCGRKHLATGLCAVHYRQKKAGKELKPIRTYTVHSDSKTCIKCGETKPKTEFYGRGNGYIASSCKVCELERSRQRYAYMRSVVALHEAQQANNNDAGNESTSIAEAGREADNNA